MICWSSNLAIVSIIFPTNYGKVNALGQAFFGIGITIGPPLGTFIQSLVGYPVPFLIHGLATLSLSAASYFIIPEVNYAESGYKEISGDHKSLGYLELFKVGASHVQKHLMP